jgi:hypothetical protein
MDSTAITQSTHLQGVGRVPAIAANDLKIGDTIRYNFGYTATVCGIIAKGKTQLVVHTVQHNGGFYQSVMNRTRLVAVAQ